MNKERREPIIGSKAILSGKSYKSGDPLVGAIRILKKSIGKSLPENTTGFILTIGKKQTLLNPEDTF
jgi:hypothetical protein